MIINSIDEKNYKGDFIIIFYSGAIINHLKDNSI